MLVAGAYGREIGLLGTKPVDVIEIYVVIDQATHRQKGVAGSVIIRGSTTLLIDLYELVDAVHPDWVRAARSLRPNGAESLGGKANINDLIDLELVDEPVAGNPGASKATVLLAGDNDTEKGRAAGVDDYQVKLGRDQLLACVNRMLHKQEGGKQ